MVLHGKFNNLIYGPTQPNIGAPLFCNLRAHFAALGNSIRKNTKFNPRRAHHNSGRGLLIFSTHPPPAARERKRGAGAQNWYSLFSQQIRASCGGLTGERGRLWAASDRRGQSQGAVRGLKCACARPARTKTAVAGTERPNPTSRLSFRRMIKYYALYLWARHRIGRSQNTTPII